MKCTDVSALEVLNSYIEGLKMNPELGFKCRALLLWIWPYNWPSTTIPHFYSTMLQASCLRLI